jgi:hypothetical protein
MVDKSKDASIAHFFRVISVNKLMTDFFFDARFILYFHVLRSDFFVNLVQINFLLCPQ